MDEKRSDQYSIDPTPGGSSPKGADPAAPVAHPKKASKPKRAPDRAQTDDERIDEASRDSFPASDPPSQP